MLGILAIAVLTVGVWPAPLVDMMNTTIDSLVAQIAVPKVAGL